MDKADGFKGINLKWCPVSPACWLHLAVNTPGQYINNLSKTKVMYMALLFYKMKHKDMFTSEKINYWNVRHTLMM